MISLQFTLNGIQEVDGSIPSGSTKLPNDTKTISRSSGRFWFMRKVVNSYKGGGAGIGRGQRCVKTAILGRGPDTNSTAFPN